MMKRAMILLVLLTCCLTTGCTHVEWFGGNSDDPDMVKIAEARF